MAKAKKKRSAVRARAKRRARSKAPPTLQLSRELVERFRPQIKPWPDTTCIDRAIAHATGGTGSPSSPAAMPAKAELRATIKARVVATAGQMKAHNEIPEDVCRKPFAEELARRIGEPKKWNYIRKDMAN